MTIPRTREHPHDLISRQTLAKLDEKLQDLPMLPMVVSRLISLDPDSDAYFDELLHLAETDPPFAARILNMANSASSHPSKQIVRLSNAIVRVGSRVIANLVSTMAVMRVFVPTTSGQRFLWAHAIEVAACCRFIARNREVHGLSEEAYLIGLLHDIGHFVMFDKSPDELARVEASNWRSPTEVIRAERDLCGFTHSELGWHICHHWELPDLVAQVVHNHHTYNPEHYADQDLDHTTKDLIRIVQMADMLSTMVFRDPKWLTLDEEALEARLLEDCMHPEWPSPPMSARDLLCHLEQIHEESQSLINALGLYPRPPRWSR